MSSDSTVSLETIAGGAAVERFNDELAKVVENILDPNTKAEQKRKIVMTFEFTPTATRGFGTCNVIAEAKLAAPVPVGTGLYFGLDGKGYPIVTEQAQNQPNLFGKGRRPKDDDDLDSKHRQ